MSKKFHEKLQDNPDSFDAMDARPGPSKYPAGNRDAVLPDHVKKLLASKKGAVKDRN